MRYLKISANDIELKYTKADFPLVYDYIGPDRTHGDEYYSDSYAWFECLKESEDLIYTQGVTVALICLTENIHLANSLHLSVIEVIRGQKGCGIGSSILADLEHFAKSTKVVITLQTYTPNLKQYYAKFGYLPSIVNKVPIMRKFLK